MLGLRIRRVFKAISGHAVSELEAQHPEAVLDHEREQLRIQIAQYNRHLAGHAGLCERLRVRRELLGKEEVTLRTRVERFLQAAKRERAAELALRLETVEEEREELRIQQEQAEETYRNLVKSRDAAIDMARAKLEGLKRTISGVKIQRAQAELSEMAASMQGRIGICDGTLDRVQEKLEEQREVAVGRARVAQGYIDLPTLEEDEQEQAALAEEALRRFEAGPDPVASESEAGTSMSDSIGDSPR
ncbi:MAG: hypothetical protein GY723_16985 [bacterium]|nr:hypothetical protein [bacterium]MCP5069338.1 hypothetical protein [bacterium]